MSGWFKLLKQSRVSPGSNRSYRRFKPIRLEALEDRLAPANFNVTTLADGGPGSGSLRAAILESNTTPGPNTINLMAAGTYQLTLFGQSHNSTNGSLQITNQSLTIANASGGKTIIDGGGIDRVFDVEGAIVGGVTFTGLTITGGLAGANSNQGSDAHGSSQDGGAIYSPQSDVTLNSCSVINNVAGSTGGGIWTDTGSITLSASTVSGNTSSGCGGMYSLAGSVSVDNSSITVNVGGGVSVGQGSITMSGSDISGNSAGNGGGVAMGSGSTGNLSISNSTITDNGATFSGGGVYEGATSGVTSITNSTISGNTANGAGAGIFTQSSTVTITGSNISDNVAYSTGGGLYGAVSTSQQIMITGTAISSNSAKNGGGLYGGGASETAQISNSTITGNDADNGGGVAFYGSSLTIAACTITGNRVQSCGSGILMNNSATGATLIVTNSAVDNNNAGGLLNGATGFQPAASINAHMLGGTITVSNSTIDGNHNGSNLSDFGAGGILVTCGTLNVTDTSIDNNTAGYAGGGAGVFANTATFTNVNIIGNEGTNSGGLDFGSSVTLTMTNCNVSDNTAVGFCGGLGLESGGTATLTSCTINGNHAVSQGGLAVAGMSLTMNSCTISGNTAAGDAGGMLIFRSSGQLKNCTISDNVAVGNGGGIQLQNSSSSFNITDCTINGNRAGRDGGGLEDIDSEGANTNLTTDTIFGNTATGSGGGLALEGHESIGLESLTIDANAAAQGGGVFEGTTVGGGIDVQLAIIAGNSAGVGAGPDVNGLFLGIDAFDLIGVVDSSSSGFTSNHGINQLGSAANPINPLLGTLENNGGPTFTQVLRPASTAIGVLSGGNLPPDQRGFPRPGAGQTASSIGAFEVQTPTATGSTANGVFVENLYETLLNRTGDSGAAGWVTALNNGASPSSVVKGIESSTEFRTIEVQQLYQTDLHRAADTGGLQNWVQLLANGGTVEQVAEGLTSSSEYFRLQGGANDAFLTALYDDALGRGGTATEQAGFLQALNAGTMTRAQVATVIFRSAEYESDVVESYYSAYLGRPADAGGLAACLAGLKSGMTDIQVTAALLGSSEGFAKRS